VFVDTTGLTNQSTLRWTREPDEHRRGYEIVWRTTTNPVWTHRIPVGDVAEATVDVSKDNVVLGVRAVGKDGHRSPAVFPFPTPTPTP
jgi:hypothetical protein